MSEEAGKWNVFPILVDVQIEPYSHLLLIPLCLLGCKCTYNYPARTSPSTTRRFAPRCSREGKGEERAVFIASLIAFVPDASFSFKYFSITQQHIPCDPIRPLPGDYLITSADSFSSTKAADKQINRFASSLVVDSNVSVLPLLAIIRHTFCDLALSRRKHLIDDDIDA